MASYQPSDVIFYPVSGEKGSIQPILFNGPYQTGQGSGSGSVNYPQYIPYYQYFQKYSGHFMRTAGY